MKFTVRKDSSSSKLPFITSRNSKAGVYSKNRYESEKKMKRNGSEEKIRQLQKLNYILTKYAEEEERLDTLKAESDKYSNAFEHKRNSSINDRVTTESDIKQRSHGFSSKRSSTEPDIGIKSQIKIIDQNTKTKSRVQLYSSRNIKISNSYNYSPQRISTENDENACSSFKLPCLPKIN